MSDTNINQCNDLMPRLAAADSPVLEQHTHELLGTELAHEVLKAIVGGLRKQRNNLQTKVNSSPP